MSSWQIFLAVGVMIVGNGIAAIVVLPQAETIQVQVSRMAT